MARMTAQDIVTEVRLHLGGETTETLPENQILRWVNRAYLELASAYQFDELEATTAITTSSGTAEYEASASDILRIIDVIDDTNNVKLRPWDRLRYGNATQGDASSITGTPVYWHISGVGSESRRQFTFYPTPDGAYTVNVVYRKTPTELVLSPSATSSVLPEPWDEVLVLLASSMGWRALGDDDKSYKMKMSANDVSKVAAKSSFTASYVPLQYGSVVGGALR
jgi:hypothetical protein